MKVFMLYSVIITVLIAAVFFLIRNDWIRNSKDTLLIPKEVVSYPSLTEQPIIVGEVELIKILDGRFDRFIKDKVDNKIILQKYALSDINQAAEQWHLNYDGKRLEKSEVWAPMDIKEEEGRYEMLEDHIAPFQEWTNSEKPLSLRYFVREEWQSRKFFDIYSTRRSGWNGTGYFRLRIEGDVIGFKAYAFLRTGNTYYPDINLYRLSDHGKAVYLMQVIKWHISERPDEEAGVYVIRAIDGK